MTEDSGCLADEMNTAMGSTADQSTAAETSAVRSDGALRPQNTPAAAATDAPALRTAGSMSVPGSEQLVSSSGDSCEPASCPEPEPETVPESKSSRTTEVQQGKQEANLLDAEPQLPLLDCVMVFSASPVPDTSPPRQGEQCIIKYDNVQLRERAETTSKAGDRLSKGELVTVTDTVQLTPPTGQLRVCCKYVRDGQPRCGWVSHVAKSGEILLEPRRRKPRWTTNIDYCAEYTRSSSDDCTPHLMPSEPATNSLEFAFPIRETLGLLAAKWDGKFQYVRTLETGERQYGFCSQMQRKDGRTEVCCICTRHPWFAMWNAALEQVDALRSSDDASMATTQRDIQEGDCVEVMSARMEKWVDATVVAIEPGALPDSFAQVQVTFAAMSQSRSSTTSTKSEGLRELKLKEGFGSTERIRLKSRTPKIIANLGEAIIAAAHPRLPDPGQALLVESTSIRAMGFAIDTNFRLPARPADATAPHADSMAHDRLFSALPVKGVLAMFAAMILELRLIFVSADLPKLSACVHAAIALLLPFEWQHIFVPVLPRIWLDYLTAPMPFVVGIHSSMMKEVQQLINSGGAEDETALRR